jgi:hypothetical protein
MKKKKFLWMGKDEIVKHKNIFIVTYPGSYTGIRKSISIAKAIEIIHSEIKFYGINLLADFGTIFAGKVFFVEKNIVHFFDSAVGKIQLRNDLDNILLEKNTLGNVENFEGKKIDFSLINIAKYIDQIPKHKIQQEYYDKFS